MAKRLTLRRALPDASRLNVLFSLIPASNVLLAALVVTAAMAFGAVTPTLAAEALTAEETDPATALGNTDQAFRAAFAAAQRNDAFEFSALAAQVPRDYPLIDYLEYWRLRQRSYAAEILESPDESIDRQVRDFIAAHADMLTGDLMRRQWLLELGRRGAWDEFETHYPDWIRRNDTRVFCRAGQSHLAMGRPVGEEAINAYERDRDLGEECGALAHELFARGTLEPADLRRRMWQAIEVRDWQSVRLLAGMLGIDEPRIDTALNGYAKFVPAIDDQGEVPDAAGRDVLLLALVSLARPKPDLAAEQMDRLGKWLGLAEQRFVWSQIAASATRDMSERAYRYAQYAEGAPVTDNTREWLAREALRQRDWPLLMRFIAEMTSNGQAEPLWVYWRARALQATGARFGAHALFRQIAHRHDYYGRLAAEELGELVALPRVNARKPTREEIALTARIPGLQRAEKLIALGMRHRGNLEWDFALRGMNDRQLLAVAHHACERELQERCINTASRTREQHDYALRFISPFRAALAPMASASGIDLAWMYGLIHQESRFLPDARSTAGARGLMQIMPATGRWIARKMGVAGFQGAHLDRLDTNVRFGSFYLRQVFDSLNNSPLLASAAYNAGPKRAREWMAALPGEVDGALFAEIIPFNETRLYVQKVLLNTAYYASVFENRPQSLKRLLGNVPRTPFKAPDIP